MNNKKIINKARNAINKKSFKVFVLLLSILTFLSFNVSSKTYPTYYFDKNCYDSLCRNNALLFDNESGKCIYEPILDKSRTVTGDIKDYIENKDEFSKLDNDSQKLINKIYLECSKVNKTASRKGPYAIAYGLLLQSYYVGITFMFLCLLLVIQGIILSYLLRKIVKKKRKSARILLTSLLILSGLIGVVFLIMMQSISLSFFWPSLSKKMILTFCSSKGFCKSAIALLPYYILPSLLQLTVFVIFKSRKNEK